MKINKIIFNLNSKKKLNKNGIYKEFEIELDNLYDKFCEEDDSKLYYNMKNEFQNSHKELNEEEISKILYEYMRTHAL